FFINVPLIAIALWATYVHVQESRDEEASPHFDWIGAAIGALAIGGLTFGAIFGAQRNWQDPIGFIGLGVGVVFTAILPFWMAWSPHPLIPLGLFKSRNFTVTNISTLLIYGALYVNGYYVGLFQQGTLGWTAAAAGLGFVPGALFLIFGSSRFGALASRYGPRWFMAIGPLVMALGVLWLVRIPASSTAWRLQLNEPSSYLPPLSYVTDFLPSLILFGIGIMITVAPLTTALMTSVPAKNSGLASAINNAISRVGPMLAGAVIFILLTNSFYNGLAAAKPGLDVTARSFRQQVSPLNPSGIPGLGSIVRSASTDSLHLAMLVVAALLLVGALVNAVGIQNRRAVAAQPSALKPVVKPAEGTAYWQYAMTSCRPLRASPSSPTSPRRNWKRSFIPSMRPGSAKANASCGRGSADRIST
ncbi:MAG TPA: MFS transporter, partial [Candidatus Acidoferrum sp.]|nr:MFS transporter [Candidatus Acidoferrum sp.]